MEQAKELIGMQMIFSLSQTLKARSCDFVLPSADCRNRFWLILTIQDWLDDQNMDELTKQKEKDRAKEEVELEKEALVRSASQLSLGTTG